MRPRRSARSARFTRFVFALAMLVVTPMLAYGAEPAGVTGTTPAVAPAPLASTPAVLLASPTDALDGLSNFATVSADLYRGAQPTATGFRTLERLGIRTVVNLRAFHSDEKLLAGTKLRSVAIRFEPWSPNLAEVIVFLKTVADPLNRPVFVHCQHGADRTGTMVALYRMTMQGWNLDDALAELPRFGFHRIWANLKAFLKAIDIAELRRAAGLPPR